MCNIWLYPATSLKYDHKGGVWTSCTPGTAKEVSGGNKSESLTGETYLSSPSLQQQRVSKHRSLPSPLMISKKLPGLQTSLSSLSPIDWGVGISPQPVLIRHTSSRGSYSTFLWSSRQCHHACSSNLKFLRKCEEFQTRWQSVAVVLPAHITMTWSMSPEISRWHYTRQGR